MYEELKKTSKALGEKNVCVPLAVSIVTGEDFKVVLYAFEEAGRIKGRGTPWKVTQKAVESLGYKMVEGSFRWAKTARTAERELTRKCWGRPVLIDFNKHVAAWDGEKIDDWSRGRCLRTTGRVFKLVPLDS